MMKYLTIFINKLYIPHDNSAFEHDEGGKNGVVNIQFKSNDFCSFCHDIINTLLIRSNIIQS